MVKASSTTSLQVSLLKSEKPGNFTPEITLAKKSYDLAEGEEEVEINLGISLEQEAYYFLCFTENPKIHLRQSDQRLTGILSCFTSYNKAVATTNVQSPPSHSKTLMGTHFMKRTVTTLHIVR